MATISSRTRAQRKQLARSTQAAAPIDLTAEPDARTSNNAPPPQPPNPIIATLPPHPLISLTRLPRDDHTLLLKKQEFLQKYTPHVPRNLKRNAPDAVASTLVFAQQEAGTAVCIHPSGLLLTCSHCIAEDETELDLEKVHWLVFVSGRVVSAKCVAWDGKRDLALLRVTAASVESADSLDMTFPTVKLAEESPQLGAGLVCIGHPGSEDLEASEAGVATGYDVLHLSTGSFCGYAEGQDLQDNSDIGALRHDCWTYWGHSGAPLLDSRTGRLVGLHSSWDEESGMRRGVALEAVKAFLEGRIGDGHLSSSAL
ncbi:trypsin-like cysteine/serine peptidase domain-containing protein [Triangularia verruculosa]|uniref:Trypsin-like cysteine/serine peptidase domain-containing protein n=1 Tax=Triangularia verruculosa TaxID=2587418 RepID=A0AAN7ASR8_9PEZI|nr:trypsin-like cysteine/serine peptidase domain-containing protein [Triangularia verruculosa]